ncbi:MULTISPECIES: diguanylate cyclase domain-containing protein [unclassified Duganella]|uniref:diguanylate cyclase domain-containing protein n=1 Tax=unclassified Duganella TaxID=2636909 RepID=UPI001E2FDE6D|nr:MULTISPECIES: diguanylate cyclase [unclassified Duganella]
MTSQPTPRTARPRLTTLVTVGVAATVLMSVLSLLVLVDHFAIDYAEREAGQRLQQLSWQMRDSLNRVVQKATGDVQLLTELPQIRDAKSPAEIRQVLESLQKTFPDYAWIGLANPDGSVYAATQGLLEGQDVSGRAWFKGGRDKLYAGDFHPATLLGKKLPYSADPWRFVDAAGPVRRSDGSYRGVLCVHMSWSWARRMVQTILAPADQQYSADIFVVRGDGTVMLGPKGTEEKTIDSTSLALSQSGVPGSLKETWADGHSYLTGFSRTGNLNDPATLTWSVLVRQSEDVALAGARALERQILLLGAILGVAMALAASAAARRLTSPLNALSKNIEQRSAAPADTPPGALPPIPLVDSFHEAQVLSQALAELVHNEQDHLATLRGMNEKLESTVGERTREIARKALLLERALAQEQSTQLLLQERAAELRAILDNAHDAFIALDPGGVVLDWNRQAEKLFGWSRAEVIGQPLAAMVLPPLLRRAYERDMRQLADCGADTVLNRRIELTLCNRAGQELPVEVSLAYVPRSSGHLFIAFLHDISERKSLFESMEAMALRDTLTGLPNRRALMAALTEAIQRASRLRHSCAVFFLDLDRFKQVNDRFGHEEGDELLRQFAARVQHIVRKTDTVGRLAGDEFIVILENLHSDSAAQETADKLRPALQQPFRLKTATVSLSASIGIAIHHPDDPQDIEMLLNRADRAMYLDKQRSAQQRLQG